MRFLKSLRPVAVVSHLAITPPNSLDTSSPDSVRDVAATLAHDTMSYYHGNTSSSPIDVGALQQPYYWWVAGALWGCLLDYYHYTGDSSYNDVVLQALLHDTNLGPNHDYMPSEHAFEEGNDDLFFWGSAVLSAAERNFPQPNSALPSWLEIAANVFNSLASRWDTSTCNGGLRWQIYPDNPNTMDYKNSISNGGFFQLSARLARATGNQTYLDWAQKIWDWSTDVGFVDTKTYHVFDGASSRENCKTVNRLSFSYTSGIYLYGAVVLADHTGKNEWSDRAEKLFDGAQWFFSPYPNSTDVLYEAACEEVNRCDADMTTQKGYLSRFLWQSTILLPSLTDAVEKKMIASAKAAVKTCTGGDNKRECGAKWWYPGFDGSSGLGQEMTALETVQGILAKSAPAPLKAGEIKNVRKF